MRKVISFLLVTFFATILVAQNDESKVLLTIDNSPISQAEFERIYSKNNQEPSFDKASLDEYMNLFVNFKLKVIEAEAKGLDTLKSFKTELKGYKQQLEKPYLSDPAADEELMKEAYERMKWNVRASHVLIRCADNALPVDTLKAYNKIMKVRAQAIKTSADFSALAKKYSEDPSAAQNGGDLGYFTAFSMVYEFETAAYNTEIGKVSKITRTKFGYHILKVIDKKEDSGQVKVAHLMRATPKGSSKEKILEEKTKIFHIYDSLIAGVDFVEMVGKYSDDRGTSTKGGELPYFGTGRMIPEFEKAAFAIKEIGALSKPIQTSYGWHIIKLIDIKALGSFEELEATIKSKVSKDIRAQKGRKMLISRLKAEYNFTENKKAVEPFYSIIDSTIYEGKWSSEKAVDLNDVMFTISDSVNYTQQDFANYLNNDKLRRVNNPIIVLVDKEYDRYIEKMVVAYEQSRLQEKYPEFKYLLQEYHDGILLFNLSDEMVWSKAVKDTAGLDLFHSKSQDKYMWGDRVEATIYTLNNDEYSGAASKMAAKIGKKNLDYNEIVAKFESKTVSKDSMFQISVIKQKFSKGDNELVDSLGWDIGLKSNVVQGKEVVIVYVNQQIAPESKMLNEARGLITADYQTYLEEVWIKELREKYKVQINQEVFDQMIK